MKRLESPDYLDNIFFEYITKANPKSNEDLKQYLRRYPRLREEIIEFTANWRALSILDKVLPTPPSDPATEKQLLRRARASYRAMARRHGE